MQNDLISKKEIMDILHAKANMAVCSDAQKVFDHVANMIEKMPTVDAEPVRHGRWDYSGRYRFKDGGRAVRCTACGCSLHLAEFLKYTWNFCPVCGAKMKMDGGSDDD